tara:strand:- start:715 stop:972 length:258 start_codon:yes stop_codon:yes gene_type:complete
MEAKSILVGDGFGESIGTINITNLSIAKILEVVAIGVTLAFGKEVKNITGTNLDEIEYGQAFITVQLVGETITIDLPVSLTTMLN